VLRLIVGKYWYASAELCQPSRVCKLTKVYKAWTILDYARTVFGVSVPSWVWPVIPCVYRWKIANGTHQQLFKALKPTFYKLYYWFPARIERRKIPHAYTSVQRYRSAFGEFQPSCRNKTSLHMDNFVHWTNCCVMVCVEITLSMWISGKHAGFVVSGWLRLVQKAQYRLEKHTLPTISGLLFLNDIGSTNAPTSFLPKFSQDPSSQDRVNQTTIIRTLRHLDFAFLALLALIFTIDFVFVALPGLL
jgi:hypothetical protein